MQIRISTRHGHLNQDTQNRISVKVSKLTRFFERLTAASVTVDLEHKDTVDVEIQVSAEHTHDFVAAESASAVTVAVDSAVHKLEQQLRKHKEKLKGHKTVSLKHQVDQAEPDAEED